MLDEVQRTDEEIEKLRNEVTEQIQKGGSRFNGLTFEDGIQEAIDWIFDSDIDYPYPYPLD